jgi:hypothetical protein
MAIADRHPLPQRAVVSDYRRAIYEYAAEVPNPQALTNSAGFGKANSRTRFHQPK